MIETMILNLIYLAFPLTLYIIYCMYANVLNKKTNNLIFTFFLVTCFYFLIRFGTREIDYLPLSLISVPLILAYINKKDIAIFLLSILTIIYYINFRYGYLIIFCLIINYVLYKLLYINKQRKNIMILVIIILNIIPTLLNIKEFNGEIVLYLIESLLLPYLIIILVNSCEKVADLHMNLQYIEHEKQVRLSIFKITHEIKNPIAVCKGYLDMFDTANKEHSKKYIPIIKSEINRTLCLLEDFLDFNKIKLEREEMDLILLLKDIKSSCLPLFSNNKISCQDNIDNSDEEIYLNGDYNRLKQVLINVIKNSVEALKDTDKPCIKFYYKLKNDYVHVYVEDNGCGMSREVLARIKEPFFTTKSNGTGLGVTISHEVIQGHKGIIKYSSKEGLGTKVEIILPLDRQ